MKNHPVNDLLSKSVKQLDDLLYIFTPEGEYLE